MFEEKVKIAQLTCVSLQFNLSFIMFSCFTHSLFFLFFSKFVPVTVFIFL